MSKNYPNFKSKIQRFKKNHTTITYCIIPWDSQYLKNLTIEILELSYDNFINIHQTFKYFLRKVGFKPKDLLFVKIPNYDISLTQTFCRLGFYPIELSFNFILNLNNFNLYDLKLPDQLKDDYILRIAKTSDKNKLLYIAKTAFKFDRYHLDPHLLSKSVDNRFYRWMANSLCLKEQVFTFIKKPNTVAGFFVIKKIDHQIVDLRLAALHPDFSGMGLGLNLYKQMCSILKSQKYQLAKSCISANNIKVINILFKLKCAKLTQPRMVLHYTL